MKRVLIAVDGKRGANAVFSVFHNLINSPEEVILLHVERLEGKSLIIEMLGDAEMNTLREMLKGTEHKEALDKRAADILDYYKTGLNERGRLNIKTLVRDGKPGEEILKAAEEERADLIILGHGGRKGLNRFITGDVAKEVEAGSKAAVLVAKRPVVCEDTYSWKDAYAAFSVFTAVVLGLFILGTIL